MLFIETTADYGSSVRVFTCLYCVTLFYIPILARLRGHIGSVIGLLLHSLLNSFKSDIKMIFFKKVFSDYGVPLNIICLNCSCIYVG